MNDRRKADPWRAEIKEMIKDIHDCIHGNGDPGIKTTVALTKQSVGRAWKILYFLLFSIVGLAIKVVAF
jgi:hypothetical protein